MIDPMDRPDDNSPPPRVLAPWPDELPRGRTAIISDVHLNWRQDWPGRIEALRGVWEGCDGVVFNGDTMDWSLAGRPRRRRAVLAHLEEVCRDDGVTPVVLAGNADANVSSLRHLVMGDVLVTHGDVIFPEVSPWKGRAGWIGRARQAYLDRLPPDGRNLEAHLRACTAAVDLLRKQQRSENRPHPLTRVLSLLAPGSLLRLVRAIRQAPALAAGVLERFCPRQNVIITGHTHWGGVWRVGGRWVINTGSFGRLGRPRAVYIHGAGLTLHRLHRRGGVYRPGKAIFELPLGRSQIAGRT